MTFPRPHMRSHTTGARPAVVRNVSGLPDRRDALPTDCEALLWALALGALVDRVRAGRQRAVERAVGKARLPPGKRLSQHRCRLDLRLHEATHRIQGARDVVVGMLDMCRVEAQREDRPSLVRCDLQPAPVAAVGPPLDLAALLVRAEVGVTVLRASVVTGFHLHPLAVLLGLGQLRHEPRQARRVPECGEDPVGVRGDVLRVDMLHWTLPTARSTEPILQASSERVNGRTAGIHAAMSSSAAAAPSSMAPATTVSAAFHARSW